MKDRSKIVCKGCSKIFSAVGLKGRVVYCKSIREIICHCCNKAKKIVCESKTNGVIHCSTYCSNRCNDRISKSFETQRKNNDGKLAFNNEKQRETMIMKYGHITPAKNEDVKKKSKETQYKNNDGKLAFNTKKQQETMLEKYGSKGRLGDPKEMERQKEIIQSKYGVSHQMEIPEVRYKVLQTITDRHGSLFGDAVISKTNQRLALEIQSKFNLKVDFEKFVEGYFYDLYIPELNILIDINPTVTHNSTKAFACLKNSCDDSCSKHKPIQKDYHQKRALTARRNKFFFIAKYEWIKDEDIFKYIEEIKEGSSEDLSLKTPLNQFDLDKVSLFEFENYISKDSIGLVNEPLANLCSGDRIVYDAGKIFYNLK